MSKIYDIYLYNREKETECFYNLEENTAEIYIDGKLFLDTKKLEAQLKEAEWVIDFYADEDNYEKMEGSYGRSYQNYHALITEDDTEDYIGGKKAREYKAKYNTKDRE